ncbi:hypothetical protein CO608_02855 [Lysobacteraceae bacterium NML08-0793]|nr:hypothetical protein CO608_02855 [Xanthomonadaceae bacterium NML08-0793]
MLLLAPAGSRRVALMQSALAKAGRKPATVLDYQALLASPALLAEELAAHPEVFIKLESPGENPQLEAALIAHGWQLAGGAGIPPAPVQHGELAWRRYWFCGFAALLHSLEEATARMRPNWVNPPAEVLAMGDKLACRARLALAGIAQPEGLGETELQGFDDLVARSRAMGIDRVFLKARYGSSAAGVVACRFHRDGRLQLESATRLVSGRLVNCLKPQRLADAKAARALIDALCRESAYAEHWIAKPRAGSLGQFDVRLVMLRGEPRQQLARISSGALTNLHLGNRRADVAQLLEPADRQRLERTGRQVAQALAPAQLMGIDVIVGKNRVDVLEANAFGDLLLGVAHDGRLTHQDQVERFGQAA